MSKTANKVDQDHVGKNVGRCPLGDGLQYDHKFPRPAHLLRGAIAPQLCGNKKYKLHGRNDHGIQHHHDGAEPTHAAFLCKAHSEVAYAFVLVLDFHRAAHACDPVVKDLAQEAWGQQEVGADRQAGPNRHLWDVALCGPESQDHRAWTQHHTPHYNHRANRGRARIGRIGRLQGNGQGTAVFSWLLRRRVECLQALVTNCEGNS
mmetsp:Transcript_58990/g.149444  ORF Transcript_58990/g.149444 Transcript_58990/m.149444 type:complete len:205 (-) Transcript_58990:196-810(-)